VCGNLPVNRGGMSTQVGSLRRLVCVRNDVMPLMPVVRSSFPWKCPVEWTRVTVSDICRAFKLVRMLMIVVNTESVFYRVSTTPGNLMEFY